MLRLLKLTFSILFGASVFSMTGCSENDLCRTTTISEKISPDKKLVAKYIEKNCGATTDYTTFLVIQSKASTSTNLQTAFTPMRGIGKREFEYEWTDKETLFVKYEGNGKYLNISNRGMVRYRTEIYDILIQYEEIR